MGVHAIQIQRDAFFELVSNGMSITEAADALGFSQPWAYKMAHQMGLCTRCGRPEENEHVPA